MKPTFFRLVILVLSTVLGVAVSVQLGIQNVSDQAIPPIDNALPIESVNYPPLELLVISVPADGEVYIGKHRVDLTEISDVVAGSLASISRNERVVYLKSPAGVQFETLALVIKEVKRADVDRIEFVLDKKKIDSLKQIPVPPNRRLGRTHR